MTTCYEFIDIKIKNEMIQARPVAWDREIYDGFGNDRHGKPVLATEFEATCPFCGNLIHFSKESIYKDSSKNDNIKCQECNAGNINVEDTGQVKTEKVAIKANKEVFIDPIASGLFDEEYDVELLKKVESAESN